MRVTAIATVFLLALFQEDVKAIDRTKLYDWSKGIKPDKVVYAINCGSDQKVTDDYGIVYQSDAFYQGGVQS